MALAGKARVVGNARDRQIGVAQQLLCPLDATVDHIAIWRHADNLGERRAQRMRFDACFGSEPLQRQILAECRLDEISYVAHSGLRGIAAVVAKGVTGAVANGVTDRRRPSARRVVAQEVHGDEPHHVVGIDAIGRTGRVAARRSEQSESQLLEETVAEAEPWEQLDARRFEAEVFFGNAIDHAAA